MLSLANWQHHRLEDRKASNRAIEAGMSAPAVDLDSVSIRAATREYTNVRITGTWDPAHTVYRRYPIVDGVEGFEVLEPLRVQGGAVYIDRGFIPIERGKDPIATLSAQVVVTVEGLLRNSVPTTKSVGPVDASPNVPTMTEVDIDKLKSLSGVGVGLALAPNWIQLTKPAGSKDPVPLEKPALDEGPHLSYMLQWICFTITILVGWGVLCWRTVRRPRS